MGTPDLALTGSTKFDLTHMIMELQHSVGRMDERLSSIDRRLDERASAVDRRLDERFSSQDTKLTDRLVSIDGKLSKHGDKLDHLTEKYHFFKGAAWVIGLLLTALVAMVGFQLKDRFEIRAVDPRPAVAPKAGG